MGGGRGFEVWVWRGRRWDDSDAWRVFSWDLRGGGGAAGLRRGPKMGQGAFGGGMAWVSSLGVSVMLKTSLIWALYTSRITIELSSKTTSKPFGSSISTRFRFGSYRVISLRCLKSAIVISGSLFFLLLPSGFVLLPESEQTYSLESFPSFFHLKLIFGVVSEAVGSLCVRSRVEFDGCRKLRCGISNSQHGSLFHDPGRDLTTTC